jgi:murein DD-endopeptidase
MLAVLAGCGSAPPQRAEVQAPVSGAAASQAAGHALKMIGRPYRYGGASPAGFDCSGLVQFSYRQVGVTVPRSTQAQWQASRTVRLSERRPGDLLFFDQEGRKNSHVGIYLGNGEFVHAPSSGKQVRRDRLDTPYWRRHISEVRRFQG